MTRHSIRQMWWLLALAVLPLATASAAVPSAMSFQAILLDDQGQIVPDASYEIEFTIHPDSVSVPPYFVAWQETQTVQTTGGLFNTMLGINNPLTADVFEGERWLQMRLTSTSQPFLPRTRIGSTPYSYRVATIDKSKGGEVSGTLNLDTLVVGRTGMPGRLYVAQDNGLKALSCGQYSSNGYALDLFDVDLNYLMRFEPDGNGVGAYFYARRNATSTGFLVDGNYAGTEEPSVSVLGSAQSATFNMSKSASESVELPSDAIEASETLDEAGVASNISINNMPIQYNRTNLLSRGIVAPTDGYVVVIGTLEIELRDSAEVFVGIANDPTHTPDSAQYRSFLSGSATTTIQTVTVCATFPVSAGVDSYYLYALSLFGDPSAGHRQLTTLFVPTAYGIIVSPDAQISEAISTPIEPDSEHLKAERVTTDRIEKEMAEMRARLLELEQSMSEQESANPQK